MFYSFILTFSNRAPDPENDSASVQEFLENMEGAFRAHTPWAGSSEVELESAGEVISLFCSASTAFVCIQRQGSVYLFLQTRLRNNDENMSKPIFSIHIPQQADRDSHMQ